MGRGAGYRSERRQAPPTEAAGLRGRVAPRDAGEEVVDPPAARGGPPALEPPPPQDAPVREALTPAVRPAAVVPVPPAPGVRALPQLPTPRVTHGPRLNPQRYGNR